MATWTTIADATLEPGKPIRSVDALALRDNPIAITEGAAGAPKVQTAGITDLAVTTAKIANSNVTSAKLASGTGERDWVLGRTGEASVGVVGTYALLKRTGAFANNPGDTVAGANLAYTDVANVAGGTSPAGTWRCMGYSPNGEGTLWLRIS